MHKKSHQKININVSIFFVFNYLCQVICQKISIYIHIYKWIVLNGRSIALWPRPKTVKWSICWLCWLPCNWLPLLAHNSCKWLGVQLVSWSVIDTPFWVIWRLGTVGENVWSTYEFDTNMITWKKTTLIEFSHSAKNVKVKQVRKL